MDVTTKEHEKYMKIALLQAREALRLGEFPVGCTMEYGGEVVATGRRTNSLTKVNEMDHAEMVALRTLLQTEEATPRAELTVYSTMEPCLMCFSTMLVNGVRKFVYAYEDAMGGGTNLPIKLLSPLYRDLDVLIIKGVLREKSLILFKDFFSAATNVYLQDSLLARYTLKQ